jgi:hypothetical protein
MSVVQTPDSTTLVAYVREQIGKAPRPITSHQSYLAKSREKYLPEMDHGTEQYYTHWDHLWIHGWVACARVLIHAEFLTQHQYTRTDMPACVIYCADETSSISSAELERIHDVLAELLHHGTNDPELQPFVRELQRLRLHMTMMPIPAKISPQYRCVISAMMCKREHFPYLTLENHFVPILHHAHTNGCVRMVPSRFWPKNMQEEWEKSSKAKLPPSPVKTYIKQRIVFAIALPHLLLCFVVLMNLPREWSFIRQSEPVPAFSVKQLESAAAHQVIRFEGKLETENTVSERKHIYTPIAGTDGRVWTEKKKRLGQPDLVPPSDLSITATVDTAGFLDADLKNAIARGAYATTPWPVKILKSSAAPTTGAKIYRIAITILALALFPLTVKSFIRTVRRIMSTTS